MIESACVFLIFYIGQITFNNYKSTYKFLGDFARVCGYGWQVMIAVFAVFALLTVAKVIAAIINKFRNR